jgi:RNA polymerase sigma-70 factor, ECF subfamily
VDSVLRLDRFRRGGDDDDPAADARLAAGLARGEPWAAGALCARHGAHVRRVLFRVLGQDDGEGGDLAQEVFVRAWRGIGKLRDPAALRPWLTHIAIFTARSEIRRRKRRRWLSLFASTPEAEAPYASADVREAASCVYRIFDRMPADERLPLALRLIDGLGLEETAAACGMSLPTVRRRLERAERRFFKLAQDYEGLAAWVEKRRAAR